MNKAVKEESAVKEAVTEKEELIKIEIQNLLALHSDPKNSSKDREHYAAKIVALLKQGVMDIINGK